MNQILFNHLCCPTCKGALQLHDLQRGGTSGGDGTNGGNATGDKPSLPVEEGLLFCSDCLVWFPVYAGVPVLLVFRTSFHDWFVKRHGERIGHVVPGFHAPDLQPEDGEVSTQDTFTEEWDQLQESELSFYYTQEELLALHRDVWLGKISRNPGEIRSILNVGVGLGKETAALQEIFPGADVFGLDINLALLRSREVGRHPRRHFVIASLFHIPFPESSFDLVYSQGVIHHTYSTETAFRSIAMYAKPRGRLFVWVYGNDDHLARKGLRGFIDRATYAAEMFLRPVLSRSPGAVRDPIFWAASLLFHHRIRKGVKEPDMWTLRNTNHSLRDTFTPRFVHRHGYNEMSEWFEGAGFEIEGIQSAMTYRRLFGRPIWGVGISGRRI